MTPQLGILIFQALLTYGPDAARELRNLFSKQTIDPADWDKVFLLAKTKRYEDYTHEKEEPLKR